MAFYSFSLYMNPEQLKLFQEEWEDSGDKLNMGKSCVKFKKLESVSLEAIGNAVARVSVEDYVVGYEAAFWSKSKPKSTKKKVTKKKADGK